MPVQKGVPSPDDIKTARGFTYQRLGVRIPAIAISPWCGCGRRCIRCTSPWIDVSSAFLPVVPWEGQPSKIMLIPNPRRVDAAVVAVWMFLFRPYLASTTFYENYVAQCCRIEKGTLVNAPSAAQRQHSTSQWSLSSILATAQVLGSAVSVEMHAYYTLAPTAMSFAFPPSGSAASGNITTTAAYRRLGAMRCRSAFFG